MIISTTGGITYYPSTMFLQTEFILIDCQYFRIKQSILGMFNFFLGMSEINYMHQKSAYRKHSIFLKIPQNQPLQYCYHLPHAQRFYGTVSAERNNSGSSVDRFNDFDQQYRFS